MLKSVLLLLLFVLVCSGIHQNCFRKDARVLPSQRHNWIASNKNFSITLLKILNKSFFNRDLVLSPMGVYEGLLLAYFGAEQSTKTFLAGVLRIPIRQNKAVTWKLYMEQKMRRIQNMEKGYPLKIANKLYLSDQLHLRKCMEDRFEDELEQIDLENVYSTKTQIMEWVRKSTGGQISDFLSNISPLASSALINAAHLRGNWMKVFSEYTSVSMPFQVNEKESATIKMMFQHDHFEQGYSSELGARLLWLPYEGDQIAMIIILPEEDLDSTIESMNVKTIQYITNRRNYKSSRISIFIPRFKYGNNIPMTYILNVLGAGNSFTNSAVYSDYTGKKDVLIDSFNHVSIIEVVENGKIKSVKDFNHRKSRHEEFVCERPFAYIVYDYKPQEIIFMGTFRNPYQSGLRTYSQNRSHHSINNF